MAKISVNGKEYDIDDLPKEAISQIRALKFIEVDMSNHSMRLAALQTARDAYALALVSLVEAEPSDVDADQKIELPDNLTFD